MAELAFHAAPPAGHWINDPNGLVHADGAYRLFVQHRADHPAFRETGWARFSSPDMLRWTFDGPVIPPQGADWAYSGSVVAADRELTAVHTLHEAGAEWQVRRTSADAGANWSPPEPLPDLGAPARNRRDPFVWRDGDGWALLLAEPCDWMDWRDDRPSQLRLYRSDDALTWRDTGVIGPWHPPGVMWEVPVIARVDGRDVLFVSTVDRREDGARCAVRAWIGTLRPDGFNPDPGLAPEGQLVDFGPDYYALMANAEGGWPRPDRCFVAWAGSWATARATRWPGFAGGPITLSRALVIQARASGPWLASRPAEISSAFQEPSSGVPTAGLGSATVPDAAVLTFRVASTFGSLDISADLAAGVVEVERVSDQPWTAREAFPPAPAATCAIRLFLDGPLVELFLPEQGLTVTAALPTGGEPFAVALAADGQPVELDWRRP